MNKLVFAEEVYRIFGAAIEVHKELGSGFLEPVYQEAMALELESRKIPSVSQKRLRIQYKGLPLDREYIADFVCFDKIIVEIKSVDRLVKANTSQVLNYLSATKMKVGLLINFGSVGTLEKKRLVL